ncbi:MAG: DinB family protein [Gemmatimonadales bacterium]
MMSLTRSLAAIFTRDLATLRMEIEAYSNERDLWRVVPGIANPGGTLALHLAGNLRHFLGAVLGATGYRRDRAAEFAAREVPREELLRHIDEAIAAVTRTLGEDGLSDADMDKEYPEPVAGMRLTTGDFLVHLVDHTGYHLGQIDYHRRILTGGAPLGGAVSPTRLWSAEKPAG